ncbi:hypothetical protein [Clostridium tertium]|uniref:hypothetical protein n=1 Tax=Clostridium tertium TaxID=1559 RepID=UPI003F96A651
MYTDENLNNIETIDNEIKINDEYVKSTSSINEILGEKEVDIKSNNYRQPSIYKDFERETFQNYKDYSEVVGFIVEYTSRDELLKINNIPDASVVALDANFAIVYIPFNRSFRGRTIC